MTPRPWSVGTVCLLAALASLAVAGPHEARAQDALPPDAATRLGVEVGPVVQSFRFSDSESTGMESLTLVTFPVTAGVEIHQRFRAELRGAWAHGILGWENGESADLSGPTDTEVRFGVELIPDAVTVTAIGLLPTGQDAHDPEQVTLAGAVAADLLPFEISHWAAGGGGGASVSAVHSFGSTGLGLDAGYRRSGEFQPTDEPAARYRPGDAVYVTGVVDHAVTPTGRLSLRLDARYFGDDELDGENLYRTGDRLAGTASYAFATGARSSALAYAGYRHRSSGAFLVDLDERTAQGLLVAGAALRTPAAGGTLTPRLDARLLRRDDGMDQGYTVGVGADGEWEVGRIVLQPTARVHVGSVDLRADEESGFYGMDLALRVRPGGAP